VGLVEGSCVTTAVAGMEVGRSRFAVSAGRKALELFANSTFWLTEHATSLARPRKPLSASVPTALNLDCLSMQAEEPQDRVEEAEALVANVASSTAGDPIRQRDATLAKVRSLRGGGGVKLHPLMPFLALVQVPARKSWPGSSKPAQRTL